MAAVMYRAAQVEDCTSNEIAEKVTRLEYENKHLRQLLQFSTPRDQLMVELSPQGGGESPSSTQSQTATDRSPFLNPNSDNDSNVVR